MKYRSQVQCKTKLYNAFEKTPHFVISGKVFQYRYDPVPDLWCGCGGRSGSIRTPRFIYQFRLPNSDCQPQIRSKLSSKKSISQIANGDRPHSETCRNKPTSWKCQKKRKQWM